jgi:hypothetical protein
MGLSPEEFMLMRPANFWLKLQGYRQGREEDFRLDAELSRLQTTELINIQLDPVKRLKPNQLWRFPWDKEEEPDEPEMVTTEEAEINIKKLIEVLQEKS